jgi:hypothetical protein
MLPLLALRPIAAKYFERLKLELNVYFLISLCTSKLLE